LNHYYGDYTTMPSRPGKRILICTAQVPFVRGGAELLVEGLRDALQAAGHLVDIISLPYSWQPHERIAESALAWRMLDLTQVSGEPIDQVICTKFPSYAVRHPNKVVWLVHQHRQIYDWYGTALSDFVNTSEDRQVRETVINLDRRTLGEATKRFTISHNVGERLQRFCGLESQVIYPPSRYASQLHAGPYGDYLLSDARLDAAKRLDLLLRALAQTKLPIRCILISTGPELQRLTRLAHELSLGERVVFRGYVADAELVSLYAGARAVYYAPFDEDYGFTAVQALAAARPLITTNDSGGVLEFIRDGIEGLVAPPDPPALARQIDRLFEEESLAAQLGSAGPARVTGITWARVVEALT
jgi:glycosyltransferase involved in cell wall biosynthesis